MKSGVSGAPIPVGLPFADAITAACIPFDFPPCLAYAVRENETDSGTDPFVIQIGAVDGLMPDGSNAGRGIMQLTSSFPESSNPAENWSDPYANARYALSVFLQPAWEFWTTETDLQSNDLIRVIGVSYNAGLGAAWAAHLSGDVDLASTNGYGKRCLAAYHKLIGP